MSTVPSRCRRPFWTLSPLSATSSHKRSSLLWSVCPSIFAASVYRGNWVGSQHIGTSKNITTHIYANSDARTHGCIHAHPHTHTHIHIHMHARTRTHIHTHTPSNLTPGLGVLTGSCLFHTLPTNNQVSNSQQLKKHPPKPRTQCIFSLITNLFSLLRDPNLFTC